MRGRSFACALPLWTPLTGVWNADLLAGAVIASPPPSPQQQHDPASSAQLAGCMVMHQAPVLQGGRSREALPVSFCAQEVAQAYPASPDRAGEAAARTRARLPLDAAGALVAAAIGKVAAFAGTTNAAATSDGPSAACPPLNEGTNGEVTFEAQRQAAPPSILFAGSAAAHRQAQAAVEASRQPSPSRDASQIQPAPLPGTDCGGDRLRASKSALRLGSTASSATSGASGGGSPPRRVSWSPSASPQRSPPRSPRRIKRQG